MALQVEDDVGNFVEKASKATGSFDKVSDKGPITRFWDKLQLAGGRRWPVLR